jgi:hypothetical protein
MGSTSYLSKQRRAAGPKRCSCKGELDGAGCFTFEEFGVGSEAEGF